MSHVTSHNEKEKVRTLYIMFNFKKFFRMEKIMILKDLSPVYCDEYTGNANGETRQFHYCLLTLTDGIDTVIGEMLVPGSKDESGQIHHVQPALQTEVSYGVSIEFTGRKWQKDDKEGYMNKCRIRKITRL